MMPVNEDVCWESLSFSVFVLPLGLVFSLVAAKPSCTDHSQHVLIEENYIPAFACFVCCCFLCF